MSSQVPPHRALELGEQAKERTLQTFSRVPAPEEFIALVYNIWGMLETSGPSGQCPPCAAGRSPQVLASEAAVVGEHLKSSGSLQLEDLEQRGARYREDYLSRLEKGEASPPPCPFFENGVCAIADARPLVCRPTTASETSEARMLEFGHAVGLYLNQIAHYRVDLSLSLPILLSAEDLVPQLLEHVQILREQATLFPSRDPIVEACRPLIQNHEPSGAPTEQPEIKAVVDLREARGFPAVLPKLGDTPLERLFKVQVPEAYRSEEEIDRWRGYFVSAMSEFAAKPPDPRETFDSFQVFDSFGLGYQGRSVKDLLSQLGGTVIEPVVAKVLPDLVQPIERKRRGDRIRVGYLSRNLRRHNGALWTLGWIRNHSDDIESFVFSTAPFEDEARAEFRRVSDHFYPMRGDVPYNARFVKSLHLDVLIFPDIGMDGANYQYAGMRLAPVQATAWGSPLTSGLSSIDYYLSSSLMEPAGAQKEYSEKLVLLPGSGLWYKRPEPSPVKMTRADFGLDNDFLILMPQNPRKSIPRWDFLFAQVCAATGRPIVCIENTPYVTTITKERMEKAGVNTKWLPAMKPQEFRRLIELADVLIDPPAWSGGNTSLEAISLGKPVIGYPGEFMRGRHTLAFLEQAGMEQLIARDAEHYVQLVCDRDLQNRAVAGGNLDGPFEDDAAVRGLDDWIRSVAT